MAKKRRSTPTQETSTTATATATTSSSTNNTLDRNINEESRNSNKNKKIKKGTKKEPRWKKETGKKNKKKTTATIDENKCNLIQKQLEKQRLKKCQEEKEEQEKNKDSSSNKEKTTTATKNKSIPKSILGKYRYDPIRNTYFPIAHDDNNSNNNKNDKSITSTNGKKESKSIVLLQQSIPYIINQNRRMNVIQHDLVENLIVHSGKIEDRIWYLDCFSSFVNNDYSLEENNNESTDSSIGMIDDDDRVRNSIPKPNKTIHKKKWKSMLAPIITKYYPFVTERYDNGNDINKMPLDCTCKLDLHPASTTFSVFSPPSNRSKNTTIPFIATILNDSIYYRSSYTYKNQNNLFVLDQTMYNNRTTTHYANTQNKTQFHSEIKPNLVNSTNSTKITNVKFAPDNFLSYRNNHQNNNSNRNVTNMIGMVSYDSYQDIQYFTLCTNEQEEEVCTDTQEIYELPSCENINDFAFDSYTNEPKNIAFASNASKPFSAKPYILDVVSEQFEPIYTSYLNKRGNDATLLSDIFCVDFLADFPSNVILYGHRNGDISLYDLRSGSMDCISLPKKRGEADTFGSVMSISSIYSTYNDTTTSNHHPYQILAQGSFGSCHLYDIRQLQQKSPTYRTCPTDNNKTLLYKMDIPTKYNPNRILSTRCSGIAFDPSMSICFSPFITEDKNIFLSSWSLSNGAFIDCIPLNHSFSSTKNDEYHTTANTVPKRNQRFGADGDDFSLLSSCTNYNHIATNMCFNQSKFYNSYPGYCELSKTITSSVQNYDKQCIDRDTFPENNNQQQYIIDDDDDKKSSWGLWFKAGNLEQQQEDGSNNNRIPPPEFGVTDDVDSTVFHQHPLKVNQQD